MTELSDAVLPRFQFAVIEDCFADGFCGESRNFVDAGKPVFAIVPPRKRVGIRRPCIANQTR